MTFWPRVEIFERRWKGSRKEDTTEEKNRKGVKTAKSQKDDAFQVMGYDSLAIRIFIIYKQNDNEQRKKYQNALHVILVNIVYEILFQLD